MPVKGSVGWAILGCGRVADRRIAPVFAKIDAAELVAFCSRDAARAGTYCERHGGRGGVGSAGRAIRAYGSLDQLLSQDDIQAIYIATPNALHAEQACQCLAAGKHVLVDKPMATTVEAASAMVEAARRGDRLLGVMHQQRFHPANVHLIRLRDEGQLGKLNVLRVQIGMWHPPGENWRASPELSGGGVVMDLGPHAFDVMLEVAGEIKSVDARTRNLQFPGPVEDFCSARLEFATGAVGLVDLSTCAHQYGGRIEAFGSKASFAAEGSMQQADLYYTWFRRGEPRTPSADRDSAGLPSSRAEPMRQEITPTDCYREAIEDFTDAVLHEGEPSISMTDGLEVLRVIEAVYASARRGQVVDLARTSP